jgi:hypothetical protein
MKSGPKRLEVISPILGSDNGVERGHEPSSFASWRRLQQVLFEESA